MKLFWRFAHWLLNLNHAQKKKKKKKKKQVSRIFKNDENEDKSQQ